jgi:hypothetical protein
MELKFSPAIKPRSQDGVAKLRLKLLTRIDEQIAILDRHEGGPLPRKSWAWRDESGAFLVGVNYGYKPLEMKKGMFAIEYKDVIDVSNALETVRQMVFKGGLDVQLAQASGEIRMKFGVRGCPGDMV